MVIPKPVVNYVNDGPVGGTGGSIVPPWSMPDDGVIVLIEVKWGDYLNQLVFHYTTSSSGDGAIALGGCDPGSQRAEIVLGDTEVIQSLNGKYGAYVDSISIVTSTQTYPSSGFYGGSGGSTSYEFSVPANGSLCGLFGRAGAWIDALGVIYRTYFSPGPPK